MHVSSGESKFQTDCSKLIEGLINQDYSDYKNKFPIAVTAVHHYALVTDKQTQEIDYFLTCVEHIFNNPDKYYDRSNPFKGIENLYITGQYQSRSIHRIIDDYFYWEKISSCIKGLYLGTVYNWYYKSDTEITFTGKLKPNFERKPVSVNFDVVV